MQIIFEDLGYISEYRYIKTFKIVNKNKSLKNIEIYVIEKISLNNYCYFTEKSKLFIKKLGSLILILSNNT